MYGGQHNITNDVKASTEELFFLNTHWNNYVLKYCLFLECLNIECVYSIKDPMCDIKVYITPGIVKLGTG